MQIGFSCALFPAVSLAYIGQAAYLRKHPEDVASTYYKSIPSKIDMQIKFQIKKHKPLLNPHHFYTQVHYTGQPL